MTAQTGRFAMSLFDLSQYRVRQLDPKQGVKPLDFGGGGITGSVNLDGRFIAINTYHPEHGYVTLTSIPPFPDEDRYDQAKVRAYRKSLVTNEGFGLQFEQEIVKREYFLIEDAVPFMRFTLADGTVAECLISFRDGNPRMMLGTPSNAQWALPCVYQFWKFSRSNLSVQVSGKIWFRRAEYTQLTEGGIVPKLTSTEGLPKIECKTNLLSNTLEVTKSDKIFNTQSLDNDNKVVYDVKTILAGVSLALEYLYDGVPYKISEKTLFSQIDEATENNIHHDNLIISRSRNYALMCLMFNGCMITDHMVLPLLWTRDSYYVADSLYLWHPNARNINFLYLKWLTSDAWRGTYWKRQGRPIKNAWARSYMANGIPKDNKAFQLDQQLYPFLAITEYFEFLEKNQSPNLTGETDLWGRPINEFMDLIEDFIRGDKSVDILIPTDETPADDELDYPYHFSTTILFWHLIEKLSPELPPSFIDSVKGLHKDFKEKVSTPFITQHKGKDIYAYATDAEGNYYLYHDANDIPLVMMPLWGFCDKDDPVWRNTIDFAFSGDNPGFYDGVLGSVHTPAPWALGDAQELIFCKVIGDRERYQRVWERVEKAAQWDGALPEAYDVTTFEVVSRHWFAWPNAMVAIADSISWDWETEGEYAR